MCIIDFMISLRKERSGGDTGAVTGEKLKDLEIEVAFWVKERNKIKKENNKFKQK